MGRVCWTLPIPQATGVGQTTPEITNYRVPPPPSIIQTLPVLFHRSRTSQESQLGSLGFIELQREMPRCLCSPSALSFPHCHPQGCSMEQQEGWEVSQVRCAGCRCCCSKSRELSLGCDPAEPQGPGRVCPTRSSTRRPRPSGAAALY